MNRIVLVGRLESTPDLRHTSTGIPVANFSLSVRRSIPNGQGRYERDVFRVVTWRKLAETCCRFLEKGRMIAVDGKLQNRMLQSPNGDRRTIVEVHADDVRFLEGAKPRTDVQEPDHAAAEEQQWEAKTDEAVDSTLITSEPETESVDPELKVELQEASVTEPAVPVDSLGAGDQDSSWYSEETDGTPLEF
jgi:single-strand DNA-binding protein